MERFSEKYGHKTARQSIQTDSIDDDLRTSLWNVLTSNLWDKVTPSIQGTVFLSKSYNYQMWMFCRELWFSFFKEPIDTLDFIWQPVLKKIRASFLALHWYEVYDFIEFVAEEFPYGSSESFIVDCNKILERELSGYRFVGGRVAPITDGLELDAIDQATATAANPVRIHLERALELLSDRQSPDYRNSIKESISAVESLVQETVGEKGTLGSLLKKVGQEINLHPALCKAFDRLYGYTSDEDGIRHALMDSDKLSFEDAKFFLVVCSAFVSFVHSKVAPKSSKFGASV